MDNYGIGDWMDVFGDKIGAAGLGIALAVLVAASAGFASAAAARDRTRFFYHGDGRIHLVSVKNGRSFSGVYRREDGKYDPAALQRIQGVFDAPADEPLAPISLRLIEFIDFLQDHFNPTARIAISSGFRSPAYNTRLRKTGRLAATASLHQYGMAADIEIAGTASRRVWDYVRRLEFGGTGYYHGATVHVDVGPARTWDEKTSGVGTDISSDNKLICLVADYDIYRPGQPLVLRFTRMTAFPIGVSPRFVLESATGAQTYPKKIVSRPGFAVDARPPCPLFADIAQMTNIRWRLPANLPAGRYRIRASFCNRQWQAMPTQVTTPVFEVRTP